MAVAQTPASIQGAWRVTDVIVTGANEGSNKSPQPGIYVFNEVMVAKNPGVMDTSQTREFKIEGNTLILIQKSPAGQPASQTTTRLTRIE
jgi:hypothetical protein